MSLGRIIRGENEDTGYLLAVKREGFGGRRNHTPPMLGGAKPPHPSDTPSMLGGAKPPRPSDTPSMLGGAKAALLLRLSVAKSSKDC